MSSIEVTFAGQSHRLGDRSYASELHRTVSQAATFKAKAPKQGPRSKGSIARNASKPRGIHIKLAAAGSPPINYHIFTTSLLSVPSRCPCGNQDKHVKRGPCAGVTSRFLQSDATPWHCNASELLSCWPRCRYPPISKNHSTCQGSAIALILSLLAQYRVRTTPPLHVAGEQQHRYPSWILKSSASRRHVALRRMN